MANEPWNEVAYRFFQNGLSGLISVIGTFSQTGATAASRIPSSAANTNPTVAKASAGRAMLVDGYNASALVTYLKLYNKATAPTVGTDVPVLTLALPPASVFAYDLDGFVFATGISYGLTTDAADAGTTAVAAGAILGLNVAYV
jgi:hypothetical protein